MRFSALGDVAMVSPVIHSYLEMHSDLEIVFLSKPFHQPLFREQDRFTFWAADVKKEYKGLPGLLRLFSVLKKEKFDAVIDLHSSLRSRIISALFYLTGHKVYRIDKGRAEKKQLMQKGAQHSKPLMHSIERYIEVFESAGISGVSMDNMKLPELGKLSANTNELLAKKNQKWIGIAPFAAHTSKEWDIEKMADLAEVLRSRGFTLLWFGAGNREIEILSKRLFESASDILIAGNFTLEEELYIMQHLDLMLTMDSANMHMASICGTKVVSIWGPTHPFAGFGPINNEEGIVQADLNCRPCTIYGKLKTTADKKCAEESMEKINVDQVLEKILQLLS